ncbi:MAG: LysE family translocator [Acidimicrobiales bacterium]
MPSSSTLLSFALVVGLVTLTPGLDTALVLRSALNRSRADAAATAAGVNVGVLVWAVAAATGVSALLTASRTAYGALRYVGAAYMVVMGLRLLRAAWRGELGHDDPADHATSTRWGAFRVGLLTNLLNPKVGAFYVALLPQFIPADGSPVVSGVALGLVHNLEGIGWFTLIILGAGRARSQLSRPGVARFIEGATGTALIGFGGRLLRSATP